MISEQTPFWEKAYSDTQAADPFGDAAAELRSLLPALPQCSRVLDLGCGEGRNALLCARAGMDVTAVDVSQAGIDKLRLKAVQAGLTLHTAVADLRNWPFAQCHDLAIAHGVLHLIEPPARDRVLRSIQDSTTPGGWNIAVVFTDAIPPPPDLRDVAVGLFAEGELFERYASWEVTLRQSYVKEDEHPGGIRHRHPVNKIVARKA